MNEGLGLFLDSLGWALLHSLWQVAAIAGAAWLALRIVSARKPALRFAIAFGGMVASLAVLLISFLGYLGAASPARAVAVVPGSNLFEWLGQATSAVSLAWSLGFVLLGLRYARALRATHRLRTHGVARVPALWEHSFMLWAARVGLGRTAIIRQTRHVAGPVTIGALRPIVLVPLGFFLQLPRAQAEAILLHELAHIGRQDYALGLVQEAIKAVFFFHPCIFWLSRQADTEREYACDDFVLAETGDARALAQGLGRVAVGAEARACFAMAATSASIPVLDRIRRLADAPRGRREGVPGFAAAVPLMLLAASCLIVVASGTPVPGVAAEPGMIAEERIAVRASAGMDPRDESTKLRQAAMVVGGPPAPVVSARLEIQPTPSNLPRGRVAPLGVIETASPFVAAPSRRRDFARHASVDTRSASPANSFRLAVAQLIAPVSALRSSATAIVFADGGASHDAWTEAIVEARAAGREAALAGRDAERAAAAAQRIGERARRIVERRSERIASLAGRLAERHARLADYWRAQDDENLASEIERETEALEVALERETEALEAELERETEAMERDLERSLEGLTVATLDRSERAG